MSSLESMCLEIPSSWVSSCGLHYPHLVVRVAKACPCVDEKQMEALVADEWGTGGTIRSCWTNLFWSHSLLCSSDILGVVNWGYVGCMRLTFLIFNSIFTFILQIFYVFVLFCPLAWITEIAFHRGSSIPAGSNVILWWGSLSLQVWFSPINCLNKESKIWWPSYGTRPVPTYLCIELGSITASSVCVTHCVMSINGRVHS